MLNAIHLMPAQHIKKIDLHIFFPVQLKFVLRVPLSKDTQHYTF